MSCTRERAMLIKFYLFLLGRLVQETKYLADSPVSGGSREIAKRKELSCNLSGDPSVSGVTISWLANPRRPGLPRGPLKIHMIWFFDIIRTSKSDPVIYSGSVSTPTPPTSASTFPTALPIVSR